MDRLAKLTYPNIKPVRWGTEHVEKLVRFRQVPYDKLPGSTCLSRRNPLSGQKRERQRERAARAFASSAIGIGFMSRQLELARIAKKCRKIV